MSVEWTVDVPRAREVSTRSIGEAMWELATRQHGVIARDQLLAAGRSGEQVRGDITAGRLRPLHRGVYAVGHGRLTIKGWWMAAVLACGDGAALSHRCAARHHLLIPWTPARPAIAIPATRRARPPGLAVHRIQRVEPDVVDAIPCTPVARTIIDMAGISRRRTLEKIVEEAVVQDVFDLREIEATLATISRPRGVLLLRSVLGAIRPGTTLTRSGLEEAMLALCRRAGLPEPVVNHEVTLLDRTASVVDFHWPGTRAIVETDSNRYHATHPKRRRDRAKDRALQLAGWIVLRVPEEDLAERPEIILADLRLALTHRVDS